MTNVKKKKRKKRITTLKSVCNLLNTGAGKSKNPGKVAAKYGKRQ